MDIPNVFTLNDQSIFKNNLTNHGAVEFTDTHPFSDSLFAMQFDGVASYLEAPHSSSLDTFNGDMTVEAWVNPSQLGQSNAQWFFAKDNFTGMPAERQFAFGVNNTQNIWLQVAGVGQLANTPTIINLNEWSHVAAVYTKLTNNLEIFINGVSDGSVTQPGILVPTTANLEIGRRDAAELDSYFAGVETELRLWNLARTAQQIGDNYNKLLTGNEVGLVAYYPFIVLHPPTRQGTGYTGISNYLCNTLLPQVTTIRIQNIFNYEPTDLAGYPAATVTAQELQGKVLDNTRNERIQRFTIRVFIDRNKQNFGASQAESILRSLADEIVLRIDAQPTLEGNCIDVVPFPARFGYIDRQNQNIRVMEITLDCRDSIQWR